MTFGILSFSDRYIALKDGTLVYYKSQLETDFGCRGAISIDKATIKSHELEYEFFIFVAINQLPKL